ncbi:MAG: hypothetical protein JWM09_143 [Francisellaceae bacterium]|nr:hypothetical protein [Francisellaceae bacterium]
MKQSANNLIWIDLEMTGLNTETDKILEIATIITDNQLNVLAEGPQFAIYQEESLLAKMDDWNTKQHTRTGLIERVKNSSITEAQAQAQTLDFIKEYVPFGKSPMCGNSICQDRRFLFRSMPELEAYFHYRNLDVSTVKELARHWKPEIIKLFKKKSSHIAMEDIRDSIDELRHYKQYFFKLSA